MSCNVGFGNQIYEVTRLLPLRELVCYYWCMRFIAQLSSIRHQYLLWVQSLPCTRYGHLALVAAFGRIWPPVENSPSDVSYKKAGSGRLKRSSTSATLLWNTAATGAPGPMCREQAPDSVFHLCSKHPREGSIQVPNVCRSGSASRASSATKRNIMEQNGTHFSVNRDFTRRAQAAWSRTGSPSAVYKTRRSGSGRPGPYRRFAPPGVARMPHSLKLVEALLSVARDLRFVRPPEPQFEEPVCKLFAFRH